MANRLDTKENIAFIVQSTIDDIAAGTLLGAFHLNWNDMDVLFTHAGINRKFFEYISNSIEKGT